MKRIQVCSLRWCDDWRLRSLICETNDSDVLVCFYLQRVLRRIVVGNWYQGVVHFGTDRVREAKLNQ